MECGGDPYHHHHHHHDDDDKSVALQDALEEVHTRFVLNVPDSELQTADRLFFQLEQAWWFYEDLICDPRPELQLPRFTNVKPFAKMLFEYSPLLPPVDEFHEMWVQYSNYKRKISNYGCILLTKDCQKMVLCQVYNGKSFTLPSGKINQGEHGPAAAARETYEETGFDPSCQFGLTADWKDRAPDKITWNTAFLDQDRLVHQEENGKRRTCYVIAGVPEDFPFAPVSRKEVSHVAWFRVDAMAKLPSTFAVLPFRKPLLKWIQKYAATATGSGKRSSGRAGSQSSRERVRQGPTPQRTRPSGSRGRNDSRSRGVVQTDADDLVAAGLARTGDSAGWSEADMFTANERILGRKVDYDGNPHVFAEEGLSKADPHAFRIVGGSFLNSSDAVGTLAPPPDRSRLQPLFRNTEVPLVEGLTPFFSDDGATPWGEVIQEAKTTAPLTMLSSGQNKNNKKKKDQPPAQQILETAGGLDCDDGGGGILPTDAQITGQSQASKQLSRHKNNTWQDQYERDMAYVRQWVANLPKPALTKYLGTFQLDAEAIMAKAEQEVSALRW